MSVHSFPGVRIREVETSDGRISLTRSSILERIKQMVSIVHHPIQEESLQQVLIPTTIPYYAVGLNAEEAELMKTYLAERLFHGAFEQWAHVDAVLAGNVGYNVPFPKELLAWRKNPEYQLTMAESDYLSEWCNPIRSVPSLPAPVLGAAHVYRSGLSNPNRLSSVVLHWLLQFSWRTHKIDFDN